MKIIRSQRLSDQKSSDDEDNINVDIEPTFDELYPQFEEEIDEEMMEIIKKHANKEDNFSYQIIEKEK